MLLVVSLFSMTKADKRNLKKVEKNSKKGLQK